MREFPYPFSKLLFVLKSRKKSFYLNGRAIKRGEGCKGRAIKEKSVKIKIKSRKKFQVMGRGGEGLRPEKLFFAALLIAEVVTPRNSLF